MNIEPLTTRIPPRAAHAPQSPHPDPAAAGSLDAVGSVRPGRPGVVLPGEGEHEPDGEVRVCVLPGSRRVPGVRAGERRAHRHLGRRSAT